MEIQLSRIKEKFAGIQKYDKGLVVFGADSHGYQVGACVSIEEVAALEQKYNIQLPEAYVAFVTQIGNGNSNENAYRESAAGPYYGIYPLGGGLEDLSMEDGEQFLSYPCLLDPDMCNDVWNRRVKEYNNTQQTRADYLKHTAALFGGLLPIGTQGDAAITCLVLNGKHKGRIVYLHDTYLPDFAHESNLLAWYERWLDELISGELVRDGGEDFGYALGGSNESLWLAYQESRTEKGQLLYLRTLLTRSTVSKEILDEIVEAIPKTANQVKLSLISIVAAKKFHVAIPFLEEQIEDNLLFVLQHIHWYAEDKAYWLPMLEYYKDKIDEIETYRFYTYIAAKATPDFGNLVLSKLTSPLVTMRQQTIFILGKLENRQAYASYFITALEDEDYYVVLYSIQALKGVKDERLPQAYAVVYQKYKNRAEDYYIIENLKHRLEEMQLTLEDLQA